MKKNFSIDEALKFSWNIMKTNFWFFVGVLVVAGVIVAIPYAIASRLQKDSAGLAFLFNVVGWIAQTIISIGMIKISLKFLDGEKPVFDDLFAFKPYFWRYVGSAILYGLVVATEPIVAIETTPSST